MGILFTFGGIGGAVGPWLVGQVAEVSSLENGMAMTVLFGLAALAMLALIAVRWRPGKKRPESL
jgi:fucose permease